MTVWGYEFYLRVLKVSLTSERSERVRDTFSTFTKKLINWNWWKADVNLLQFLRRTMSKGKGAKRFHGIHVKHQPCQARPHVTGGTPYTFRTVMWVRKRPLLDHETRSDFVCQRLLRGDYVVGTLSWKKVVIWLGRNFTDWFGRGLCFPNDEN